MQYEVWDFENDHVVTNRTPLFPKEEKSAIRYMGSAYAVDTEKGIFYHEVQRDRSFNLLFEDSNGTSVFLENICVIASNMKYSCIIVYCLDTGEVFLIDTRGVLYLLDVIERNLFLNPAQYRMCYNKETYFYEIGNGPDIRWRIRGISKEAAIKKMLRKMSK